MSRGCWLCLLTAVLPASAFALGHSKKLTQIDIYCRQLEADFANSSPFVFSGPDPWIQMDELPGSMPNDALAYVYAAGADIRWVFLRIVDADDGWSEDVNYFFQEDGSIVKRVRLVQNPAANILLEVTTYYKDGRVLKQSAHHHALGRGHQDSSRFTDPDAPVFWTVDDLPFPKIPDLWRRLA
jgi:hypothetical protein